MARKTGGKMGGRIGWLLFAAVVWFVYKNFTDEASVDHADEAEAGSDAALSSDAPQWQGAYAATALRDDWPPLPAEQDAAPVAAASAPTTNYYVVLDGSGSMRRVDCSDEQPKIKVALAALARFVQSVPAEANLGLAVFDDAGLSERVPLGLNNRDAVQRELQQVDVSGGTPLKSAIELGYDKLTEQARSQLGYGDYHLVLVTDGYPDPESEDPAEVVTRLLDSSPVVLHTIGFCIGEDHVLNQPGRVYYTAANSPDELQKGLGGVLAEAPSFDLTAFEPAPQ